MNNNMFLNFAEFKQCVLKHANKLSSFKLPTEALELLVDQFGQGDHNKSERIARFVDVLRASDCCYSELFEYEGCDAPFAGAYGAVFIEDSEYNLDLVDGHIARKFFMGENQNLNVLNNEKAIFDAFLNMMNYVLFKVILIEAEERNFIPKGIADYVLDTEEFFVAEGGSSLQIGFTTRYIRTNWKKATPQMKKRTVAHINNFLRAINSLRQYGIYLTHGDLKMGNIVYDKDSNKPYVIDFGISSARVEYHEGGHNFNVTDFVHFPIDGTELAAVDIAMFGFCYNRTFNQYDSAKSFADLYYGVDGKLYNVIVKDCTNADNNMGSLQGNINSLMYRMIYSTFVYYYALNQLDYKAFASDMFVRM